MYYYSTDFARFLGLKNVEWRKNFKFFHFFIAQFKYWQYLCTAFFGRGLPNGA